MAISLGIADPIGWMDETPPEVIDRWLCYCAENPIPDSWQQTAAIAAEVYGVSQWLAAQAGQQLEPRPASEWIPTVKPPAVKKMTSENEQTWLNNLIGI